MSIIAGYQRPCIGANTTSLPDATAVGYRLLPRRSPRCLPHGAGDIRRHRRPQRGAPGLPRHGGSLPLMSQSARKRCAASPVAAALLARAPRPGIPQRGQAAGGVVQSRAWTVTWTCERCGVRTARIRSALVPGRRVRSVPKRVERLRHRKRSKPSMTHADAIGWRRTDLEKIARFVSTV